MHYIVYSRSSFCLLPTPPSHGSQHSCSGLHVKVGLCREGFSSSNLCGGACVGGRGPRTCEPEDGRHWEKSFLLPRNLLLNNPENISLCSPHTALVSNEVTWYFSSFIYQEVSYFFLKQVIFDKHCWSSLAVILAVIFIYFLSERKKAVRQCFIMGELEYENIYYKTN